MTNIIKQLMNMPPINKQKKINYLPIIKSNKKELKRHLIQQSLNYMNKIGKNKQKNSNCNKK